MAEGQIPSADRAAARRDRLHALDADLLNPASRVAHGFSPSEDEPVAVVVELSSLHVDGLDGSWRRLSELYRRLLGDRRADRPQPTRLSAAFAACHLSVDEADSLVRADRRRPGRGDVAVDRIWLDYQVRALVDRGRTMRTIKADSALRLFGADGAGVTWAVIDSGVDGAHPHFQTYATLGGQVAEWHRAFVAPGGALPRDGVDPAPEAALIDLYGHGTHVAGIIAGGLPARRQGRKTVPVLAGRHVPLSELIVDARGDLDQAVLEARGRELEEIRENENVELQAIADPGSLGGVAPRSKLVSLKVLDERGVGRTSGVIRALRYIREGLNSGRLLQVHGVNMSIGYDYNVKAFPCGGSPLCVEVDRLVRSGVAVVAAAGNTGFGALAARSRATMAGYSQTINDPGNAALAITVGSVHGDTPHTFGISYFSSKGPTLDGRAKPDLVAPGERVISCAAGKGRAKLLAVAGAVPAECACYIDESGTSMAAPHVSGAIAGFLSVHREFIGRPEYVKRIFLETATSLGRDPAFQGRGLVDLLRAIQVV